MKISKYMSNNDIAKYLDLILTNKYPKLNMYIIKRVISLLPFHDAVGVYERLKHEYRFLTLDIITDIERLDDDVAEKIEAKRTTSDMRGASDEYLNWLGPNPDDPKYRFTDAQKEYLHQTPANQLRNIIKR